MKHRVIILTCVVAGLVMVALPWLITKGVEWRIRSSDRMTAEVGYSIPADARIIDTEASIWTLADGANYTWTISSPHSLLPWIESLGTLEWGETYKVVATRRDGRKETSYITLAPDRCLATVETFRP